MSERPWQNRVTPAGELVRHASRAATLMGNRGCLHDNGKNIVRRWRGKAWVCCVLKDPRLPPRKLMTPGLYTELFFLDEATALAAGHRPCFYCRRTEAKTFTSLWCTTQGLASVSTKQIDQQLHTERTTPTPHLAGDGALDLPDGTIVRAGSDGAFFLVKSRRLRPWSFDGYGPPLTAAEVPAPLQIVTPPSSVALLATGYPTGTHPSAAT